MDGRQSSNHFLGHVLDANMTPGLKRAHSLGQGTLSHTGVNLKFKRTTRKNSLCKGLFCRISFLRNHIFLSYIGFNWASTLTGSLPQYSICFEGIIHKSI